MADALARRLAQWCSEVQWADLPVDQRNLTRLRILDSLGLILAAVDSPQGEAARTFAQQQSGAPQSVLIGSEKKLPASWAAFYHATLAHSFDFDDTFLDSVIHPGSVIVPVALAAAEANGATGEELMLAVAIGYEVAARLGSVAGRDLHARGFHATGIVGPVAGSVVAARLNGLSVTEMTNSLALAGSMSSGLLEFLSDGSWSKWVHCGWAAHGAIVAAQLGAAGFSGPGTVLEGSHGLYKTFLDCEEIDFGSVTADLGDDWRGAHARFKLYPCAHVIQPFVDAMLRMRAARELRACDVAEVRCVIAPWCVPLVCEPRQDRLRPQTPLQAIASLPYLVAAALVDGRVTLETVTTPQQQNPAIYDLAERVHHVADSRLGSGFDGQMEIETLDGRKLQVTARLAEPDEAVIREKFRQNAIRASDSRFIEALENEVFEDSLDPVRIFSLLASHRRIEQRPVEVAPCA